MFKFGIIGAGNISRLFCEAVRIIGAGRVEVAAVASKDIDRAKSFAGRENIENYFGGSNGYEEMLKSCDLDAVYIATTNNFHYENALLCLNHGKPVMIEKPMAVNKKQAEEIFALAKSKNLFVTEAMWACFLPHAIKARSWIADGKIGELIYAQCSAGFKAEFDPKNRFFNPELGGGALYDVGVYLIEGLLSLLNLPVKEVKCMVLRAETGVDFTDNISVMFENNCIAKIFATFAARIISEAHIYGTDGHIIIPTIIGGNECTLYRDGKPVEHFKQEYENGFVFEIEETMRCINSGLLESPVFPHPVTLKCCEIFDLVLGQ